MRIYLIACLTLLNVSESNEHQCLVEILAQRLTSFSPDINVFADLPTGFEKPPKVSGFIPDVYGQCRVSGRKYIGEAKTRLDLETSRSQEQIMAFIDEVNKRPTGVFCLAGFGETATRAKTILRFLIKERNFAQGSVQVFDGLDYWGLKSGKSSLWHLC